MFCGILRLLFFDFVAQVSHPLAKFTVTVPWIHSGAQSTPLCTQVVPMADFAGRREIWANMGESSHQSSLSRPQNANQALYNNIIS